ncbi:glycosyltransferase family 2 protein [Nocardioides ochotonae]|uniref:glycosyltransferase family 2 protein n=1 Tax=Nocardioides ochotonae TaxID=2685869 RepID=UPI001409D1C6|nr:glycosyltransferase family 2 protein [Nocardioides ochotonae]
MSAPQSVVALLVSHDGERWLPAVLKGLADQTHPVDHLLAVDTGSKDESVSLLEDAPGVEQVLRAPLTTSFPAAVRLGLAAVAEAGLDPEWVWLLHDDANPDPGCLAALLAAAEADPGADLLGPKLREWPSLRRLLELGVTISDTGRRETGLERGEYDQGQHDQVRTVLAVNTAGMLVRRRVLESLGGLDDALPLFGNDIDLGWRAAQAGHRTIVVPQAVVFHAEAAHRGLRRTPLTGRHTHYQERRAALFTLLANAPGRSLPFRTVRLALGTVLRVLGFLLVRAVGEALDELAALISVYAHPGEVRAARRRRREQRSGPPADVRHLLAPRWLPYRHGLDFLGDLVSALSLQASDVAERRRLAAAEADPSSFAARRPTPSDEDTLEDDSGIVARFVTNPVALLLAVFVLLALVGSRAAFGTLVGGGLSPVPSGAGEWWRLWLSSWHEIGSGTAVPAPAYLLPLALLATLLLGSAKAAVTAVMVLAVPVALWGAWRFLRVVGRLVSPAGASRWLVLLGATTYALVPVVSGAWGDGRLGVVASAAVLPWLAHAALGFADPAAQRRWRAAWRTGVLLALVSAFTPVAWLVTVAVGLVVVAAAALVVRSAVRDRSVWGPPATAVGLVPLLLAPWWIPAVVESAAEGLLLDVGRLPGATVEGLGLLAGRFADLGAPLAVGLVPVVLAVLALVPRATRVPVLVCWLVAVVTAAVAAVLGAVSLDLAAVTVSPGTGFLLVLLQGAFVVAAVIGAQGLLARVDRPEGPAPVARGAVAVLAVVAAAVPLTGLAWFVAGGDAHLDEDPAGGIPAYMLQSAETGPEHGILVVRGTVADGLTYEVRRGDGVTLGEDEILDLSPEDTGLSDAVRELASAPTPDLVTELADRGIEYVVLPAPADGDVAASLDATGGLLAASAEDRTTRAWQVDRPLSPDAVDGPTSWLRVALLVLQGVALVWVLVLCAPTTNRRRS